MAEITDYLAKIDQKVEVQQNVHGGGAKGAHGSKPSKAAPDDDHPWPCVHRDPAQREGKDRAAILAR